MTSGIRPNITLGKGHTSSGAAAGNPVRAAPEQDWQSDVYKGLEIHVTALARSDGKWDFSVRIAQPGEDAGSASELMETAGDGGSDDNYGDARAAIEAGFRKGYAMADELLG